MPKRPVDDVADAPGEGFRGWWRRRRRPVAAAPPVPEPEPTPVRPTLLRPDLQEAFARDGYVVVDLLSPGAVADMRRRYDRMDHETHTEWPFVDGFETSLYDQRRDYRGTILDDFEAVIAPALADHLIDHRIMFANYTVKLPQGKEVPLHVDWTFLDEERFRSATVWCPLIDTAVDAGNGPLGVVKGSQERIDFLRIVNVPCYDRTEAAVPDLERVVLDLRAGQAIIMDNRTVHFSLPNETDEERVVAACVVGPAEADLHHWYQGGDGDLIRYTIDQTFYLTYDVGRPAEAEGIIRTDVVPADVAVA